MQNPWLSLQHCLKQFSSSFSWRETHNIEGMVVEGLDAISLACNEPAACTIAIEAADAQGIPMFTFDCTSNETDVIKCFVGTDNYQGGVVGGEATIAWLDKLGLKEGATVGIIGYPEPQSCIDRENGWMEVMNAKKDEYKLNIVNIGNYKGDASTAQQLMEDALTSYPDMAVIFTVGDPACIGALAAIKGQGASTKMIGFDANPEAHEAILDEVDGQIWVGDVAQDPYQIGYKIAEEMVKYLMSEFETDKKGIWETNLFGKSLNTLVREEIQNKLSGIPADAQNKVRRTLGKMVNEGRGGMICILL